MPAEFLFTARNFPTPTCSDVGIKSGILRLQLPQSAAPPSLILLTAHLPIFGNFHGELCKAIDLASELQLLPVTILELPLEPRILDLQRGNRLFQPPHERHEFIDTQRVAVTRACRSF